MTIPGRMETVTTQKHGLIVVDYAHNKASMLALMRFMRREFTNPRIIVVVARLGTREFPAGRASVKA